jgi:SAM-dependent methyltransferase
MQPGYQNIAAIYDLLQRDVDYGDWADYIQWLDAGFSRRQRPGDGRDGRPILLDLGCGTGCFCQEMAKRGYDPIGIDTSAAMLDQARQKDTGSSLFLQQDISRFELFGTVDLAVCLLDTLNHLIRPAEAARLFRLCANYLNPGALLIFDTASKTHLRRTLGRQCFFHDAADFTLLWQNSYRESSGISRSEILLFSRENDDCYRRSETTIVERYYSPAQISAWLREAGLELVARSGRLDMPPPASAAVRRFYIARRPAARETAE